MFECLLWRSRSAVDCPTGRGSGCSIPEYGISPLEGGRHQPHHRATRTCTELGKQTLGGHKQNPVHTRTQKKGAMTLQETGPYLPISVQESLAEAWVSGDLLQGWGQSVAVHAWDLLKEVTIIFITSTIVQPQVNNREGTQPHPSTENWTKDLLSMAQPIRTRPSFPLRQFLPSGSFHQLLILLHQRTDRLKTIITEN